MELTLSDRRLCSGMILPQRSARKVYESNPFIHDP